MKFYWFCRHNYFDIKNLFVKLESAGFDGVLLAYAQMGDPFSVLAHNIMPSSKMEYIVAVRPYLISPQYVSEIVESFESFAPGRLSLNIVPGAVIDSEKIYGGIIGEVNDSSSQEDRRNFLGEWIKEYSQCRKTENKIYVSGHHCDIVEYSEYSDSLIMNYRVYNSDYGYIPVSKPFYISMSPVIQGDPNKIDKDDMVVSRSDLKEIIEKLEKKGVEGIFFHSPMNFGQLSYIIDFVKDYKASKQYITH